MRFYRLLRYDLRQGLQRRNYLIATLLFSMRLFAVYRSVQFYCNVESISSRGSIGDYMLCLFRGMRKVSVYKVSKFSYAHRVGNGGCLSVYGA